MRRHSGRGHRSGFMVARPAHRARDAGWQALAARDREIDALSRVLREPVLGPRDEEEFEDWAAPLLSAAQMGRGRRGAVMGQRCLHGGCCGEDVACSAPRYISMSSATSRLGAECVIAPEER